MKYLLISPDQSPPDGFQYMIPAKRDILGNIIALYASSLDEAIHHINRFLDRISGVIITPGKQFEQLKLTPTLWHLKVTSNQQTILPEILMPMLQLLDVNHTLHEENKHLKIELQYQSESLRKIRERYYENINRLVRKVEALRESEESLRTTLLSIGDAVIATDLSGNIIRMNQIAEQLTGYTLHEVYQTPLSNIFNIIHAHTGLPVPNPVDQVLNTGKIVELANHTILIAKDETQYHIADSGAPIRNSQGEITGVVLVFRDVTDSYLKQKQLQHQSKMDAIGQLAGGIAHDFNNMLTGIMGAAQLLQITTDEEEQKQSLKLIINTTRQAAKLVSKLMIFSRKGDTSPSTINIHKVIDDSVEILRRSIDKKVVITTHSDAQRDLITGNFTALQNVIINLGINAAHAMPDGGTLNITTGQERVIPDTLQQKQHHLPPGEYLKMSLSDTGVGIPQKHLNQIFDPFFTTKNVGEGTGLGLSIVYGTIQEHNGSISVSSAPGHGTTFEILLPLKQGQSDPVYEQDSRNNLSSGSETILLVDDEEIIQITGKALLEKLGYTVIVARDGLEAVEIFQQRYTEIDLVMMDMMMPRMSGYEAFFQLKKIDPDIKIMIASGYSREDEVLEMKQNGLLAAIKKPFRIEQLSKILSSILGRG